MAKTIATQYGEFLNYDNLVRIGVITNWEDAEPDENGIITVKPMRSMRSSLAVMSNAVRL